MPKIDKTAFTKHEWQRIKEARRQEKATKNNKKQLENQCTTDIKSPISAGSDSNEHKNYVVCLKHGFKYSADYVNVLYSMVQRNLTVEHEFVCFTEDSTGINPNIRIEPLPVIPQATGWWYKPMFFNPDLPLKGTVLFFDLDVIIFRNIDYLFTHAPKKFCILRDFNRHLRPTWEKFNSSVFRLETGSQSHVYKNFVANPALAIRKFHGDQDWIYSEVKSNYEYWPNEWIQSYKWEMRKRASIVRDAKGTRNFSQPGVPEILPQTSVAVFHGEPNPHNCIDPWCKENWR